MRLREGEADMDIRIVDVLVDRTSDTDAVLKAITALDEFGGAYEVLPDPTEPVWKEGGKSFFPRAIYNFTGKYRYRICIWCIQDLPGQEKDQDPAEENRVLRRFLESEEKQAHVIVRVGVQRAPECGRQEIPEENPDSIVFAGKIFL